MFRPRETGCDGHVHIYGYCDKLRPNGLKLSAGNYRMWLYSENSYVQTR